jgi:hypothetical protein
MICPRCGAENFAGARFCSNCGRDLSPRAVVARSPLAAASGGPTHVPDPQNAFWLEFLLGIFGFLGIGWIYAGHLPTGLVMLIGWWVIVVSGLGGSLFTGGLGCCLWLPVHFVAPFVSALIVRREVERYNSRYPKI